VSIGISEEHVELAASLGKWAGSVGAVEAIRAAEGDSAASFDDIWAAVAEMALPAIALPESVGGGGGSVLDAAVALEAAGQAMLPGPLLGTTVAGILLASADPELSRSVSEGASVGLGPVPSLVVDDKLSGTVDVVWDAPGADLFLVGAGERWFLVPAGSAEVSPALGPDLSRRFGSVALDGVRLADVVEVPGLSAETLHRLAVTLATAEAAGVARWCLATAVDYAKVREQFGQKIGSFQAVKHLCAQMLETAEAVTAVAWDAASVAYTDDAQWAFAADVAGAVAFDGAVRVAQDCIQVLGGTGFTFEHDAHLYLRRATAIAAVVDAEQAAVDATDLTRAGVMRERSVDLPPEAEEIRRTVRSFVAEVKDLDREVRRSRLIDDGYAMPHWPAPWGRDASAVEQLVIEQEFTAAGIQRPAYGITGWVILTLIQYATDEQVARWVRPALDEDVIWCQLFSEPDAGSDAAGVKTRGTRVDGGWLINGQKVWTSGAHVAKHGFATVRTNPDAPKHNGITTMVIDMEADRVEVRPLRMPTGGSEFNEVFFDDVFVPDDDVVGPVDGGWTVARATLGNESVSIGGGSGGMSLPGDALITALDAHPERLPGGAARVGRYIAAHQTMAALNLRSAHRAVSGGGPGPEGNVTKLVLSEIGHEAAAVAAALAGPDAAYFEGPGAMAATLVLANRALSIAGGTSEIKRNQIGERILGLPRDPLIN
jgi:alkylation response protein AidB-like acyl-CoA dehydrogenase